MTQFKLDGKPLTEVERLRMLRLEYYIELLQEFDKLRRKRIELIKNYKQTTWEIDKQIERKSRSKDKSI